MNFGTSLKFCHGCVKNRRYWENVNHAATIILIKSSECKAEDGVSLCPFALCPFLEAKKITLLKHEAKKRHFLLILDKPNMHAPYRYINLAMNRL